LRIIANKLYLKIDGAQQPWEVEYGKPSQIVSALDIMLEGPIGAASFNNEFGRPNILGYFRTYEQATADGDVRGYHKPIMLAGGLGHIQAQHIKKGNIPVNLTGFAVFNFPWLLCTVNFKVRNTKPTQTHSTS
jgi:phosphoribosylformylglycinamidine (FGAM) synthase-like enzyme